MRRSPLTLIASAPAVHRASVSSDRSESRTSWLLSLPGALATVAWMPGPLTDPEAGAGLDPGDPGLRGLGLAC